MKIKRKVLDLKGIFSSPSDKKQSEVKKTRKCSAFLWKISINRNQKVVLIDAEKDSPGCKICPSSEFV